MKYLNQINFLLAAAGCAVVAFALSQTVWTEPNRVAIVVSGEAPYEGPAVVTRAPTDAFGRASEGMFSGAASSGPGSPLQAEDEDSTASDDATRIDAVPGGVIGGPDSMIPQPTDQLREALRDPNVIRVGERPAASPGGGSQPAPAASEAPQQQRFATPSQPQRTSPPFVQGTESQKRQPTAGSPPPVRGSMLERRPPR
ncbi:MAG TPA: hypothetical protein VMN76_06995 [Acidobacteriota bacterium]|nr:hypothetical protein [Acidobacteriota bacterium]